MRDQVLSALLDEGFEVASAPIPPNAPVEWSLLVEVKVPLQVKINIQKPKGVEGKLIATMALKFSPFHLNALSSLPPQRRREVVASIVLGLLTMCPDCIVIPQPPDLEKTEALVASREIRLKEGELDGQDLARTVRVLSNAFQYTVVYLTSLFGQPGPGKGQTTII
ncbi:hypothetical protein JCM10135_10300 [Stetteria hydrogenophila]